MILAAHKAKLAQYEAVPEAERDWILRGSIEYHRECIRHLERMERESEDGK
jgi:hypothetical protein